MDCWPLKYEHFNNRQAKILYKLKMQAWFNISGHDKLVEICDKFRARFVVKPEGVSTKFFTKLEESIKT